MDIDEDSSDDEIEHSQKEFRIEIEQIAENEAKDINSATEIKHSQITKTLEQNPSNEDMKEDICKLKDITIYGHLNTSNEAPFTTETQQSPRHHSRGLSSPFSSQNIENHHNLTNPLSQIKDEL